MEYFYKEQVSNLYEQEEYEKKDLEDQLSSAGFDDLMKHTGLCDNQTRVALGYLADVNLLKSKNDKYKICEEGFKVAHERMSTDEELKLRYAGVSFTAIIVVIYFVGLIDWLSSFRKGLIVAGVAIIAGFFYFSSTRGT